jgi:hypothetical protein
MVKLRYKRGGKHYKEWFVYLSKLVIPPEFFYAGGIYRRGTTVYAEAMAGVPLYEFTERRKLIRILSSNVEGHGKVAFYNPERDGSPMAKSAFKSIGSSVSLESALLEALK